MSDRQAPSATTDRLPCTFCGALILGATAASTGGLCMPCKGGYRESIEASKRERADRKREEKDPDAKHWVWLVEQVCLSPDGIYGLSPENRWFFAVFELEGEVYNGGFDQYFTNSSGDRYEHAVTGLQAMGATESLALLLAAKELLFGSNPVPGSQAERFEWMDDMRSVNRDLDHRLDHLDEQFWKHADGLREQAARFTEKHCLLKPFLATS